MKIVLYYRYGKTIEPKAALPLLFFGGFKVALQTKERRVIAMYVTYQDLIQIGILVVALANLIYQIYKDSKK